MSKRKLIPLLVYILFLLVPIYWLLNMSFKSNTEILGGLTLVHGHTHRPAIHKLQIGEQAAKRILASSSGRSR